jgi:post-segregation antitoxin (ccd killing protein)
MKTKEVYVKKTLTIPMSLDIRARENNINFSATLVKGIKDELEEIERKKKEE